MAESGAETHRLIKKRKTNASGNVEDVDTGASGSMTVLTETNLVGSGSSPTEINNSASNGNCYEVFLSFRGRDTRYGFTDHLYDGLLRAGIHTFRDDDKLCQGEDIRPELMAAITNSKVLIPIFSVNYGTSSWCLDELVQIMERKNNNEQKVLPIFYKVKPADVGHQIGSFGKAFHEREKRLLERSSFNPAILEKWKQALLEVSNLKGHEAEGSEVELVKSVVRKVLNELKKKFELIISKNLVGIDSHVKSVMEFLDDKSHALLFVGIHGMGGIGKTTLAKTIYNKLSNQLEHRSFIADIRESWKRGAHDLQNQLIYDISNQKNEVRNKDEGINFISSRFKDKKVLLLLDDVDEVDQVKCLAGNHDWFSLGSRIIITTRNKRILEEVGVDYPYDHKEMDKDQSLMLFSKHAFRRDSPPREFKDLTHEVVSIAAGLPLSLEIFGSLLCGKESKQWRETIKKLKKVPNRQVQEKLRISYEALDYGQKQIFLDIACFFIGKEKTIPFYMWDTCDFFPGEGIEVLIFMSLIKVESDDTLRMHDQLRDLGREIVREENQLKPWCRSRLWDYEEVEKVLKESKGTGKIEGINLSEGNSEGFGKIARRASRIYAEEQFKNLTSLRFLHLDGACLSGDFKDSMEELRWLRWPYCPAKFEVKNFGVKKLAVLELIESEINDKWEGWNFFMMAEKLIYLNLSYCLSLENTDFLLAFKKLEVLILNHCESLKRINASIEDMEGLLRLELRSCFRLRELPIEIGKLKALQKLDLCGTQSLYALPDSIGSLENLEILDISLSGIEELPSSIESLRNLRELRAYSCRNLKRIMVESMCNLSSLRCLQFIDCYKLQSLPDLPFGLIDLGVTCRSRKLPLLSHLAHLEALHVKGCEFLQCIQELPSTPSKSSKFSQPTDIEESKSPQFLNTPFKFEFLHVAGCGSIETLDVSQFVHLRTLTAYLCKNLLEVRVLDKLIYLESLTILHCHSIKWLDLPKFEGLKELCVRSCDKLAEIQGLDRLEYLESLDIQNCALIERLDLPKFGRLKELHAENCENLAEIQGLDSLEYLEGLHIYTCTSIERLDLSKSGSMTRLVVVHCNKLAEIQGIDRLESLETLSIYRCASIERLLFQKSKSLKILKVKYCENLVEIHGLDRLKYLESLDMGGCNSIEKLNLPKFGRLKKLDARDCENLAQIQGLDSLEYLESIYIFGFTSIGRLHLPKSGSMKRLVVGWCKKLAEIQGIDRLESLEILNIFWCTSIERLLLQKFKSLKILKVTDCENLVEIQGLDRLEYLESLVINDCNSIERLDLPKFERLKKLDAKSSKNLAEIQGLDSLEYLERLDISRCTSIGRLDLAKFGSMKILDVGWCKKLTEIQGIDRLESLEMLNISECFSIERLLLKKSKSLEILEARFCENLIEIQGLDRLEYLKILDMSGCNSIERLDLPKFGGLKILDVRGCENLVEIHGLDSLECLESLDISRCTSIGRLDLPKSGSMKRLVIGWCKKLAKIQGIDRLESLETLNISWCTSIERLLLQKSESLKILEVIDCENLVEIQGLDRLEYLESLDISGCNSIEKLDLPKFGRLKKLDARGCENLAEIQELDSLEYLKNLDI